MFSMLKCNENKKKLFKFVFNSVEGNIRLIIQWGILVLLQKISPGKPVHSCPAKNCMIFRSSDLIELLKFIEHFIIQSIFHATSRSILLKTAWYLEACCNRIAEIHWTPILITQSSFHAPSRSLVYTRTHYSYKENN